jgi:hypothetical protein
MVVASKYGIPRSQLLGREPAQITTYEYDDSGSVIRSITTCEPRWTDEDLAWAVAWILEQADRCPGCSLPLSETTAMQNGRPAHKYRVEPPRICRACEAVAVEQEEYDKLYKNRRKEAEIWEAELIS